MTRPGLSCIRQSSVFGQEYHLLLDRRISMQILVNLKWINRTRFEGAFIIPLLSLHLVDTQIQNSITVYVYVQLSFWLHGDNETQSTVLDANSHVETREKALETTRTPDKNEQDGRGKCDRDQRELAAVAKVVTRQNDLSSVYCIPLAMKEPHGIGDMDDRSQCITSRVVGMVVDGNKSQCGSWGMEPGKANQFPADSCERQGNQPYREAHSTRSTEGCALLSFTKIDGLEIPMSRANVSPARLFAN
ncbi:hypothetical protein KQX54_012655 [Cotesia glomerata]|uniref:Uncharacterized protein n=1 Tax=Cotesia glomerata TaxID=32391 RepID=A0AAV7J2U5_COTGL|nr:hypothetical protein KQX54_012655 [Cotesia glomerata]